VFEMCTIPSLNWTRRRPAESNVLKETHTHTRTHTHTCTHRNTHTRTHIHGNTHRHTHTYTHTHTGTHTRKHTHTLSYTHTHKGSLLVNGEDIADAVNMQQKDLWGNRNTQNP